MFPATLKLFSLEYDNLQSAVHLIIFKFNTMASYWMPDAPKRLATTFASFILVVAILGRKVASALVRLVHPLTLIFQEVTCGS
jgi:hypothetical protein